jgi:hypothetical protein
VRVSPPLSHDSGDVDAAGKKREGLGITKPFFFVLLIVNPFMTEEYEWQSTIVSTLR